MQDVARWAERGRRGVFVEQRCGPDAVVVRVPVGHGRGHLVEFREPADECGAAQRCRPEAAAGEPGRRAAACCLTSPCRSHTRTQWSATRGLPLWWMLGAGCAGFASAGVFFQSAARAGASAGGGAAIVAAGVCGEYGRPVRESRGHGGGDGGGTPTAGARAGARSADCRSGRWQAGPDAVVARWRARFGGVWRSVGEHLGEAARGGRPRIRRPGSALKLVRALGEDAQMRVRCGQRRKLRAGGRRLFDQAGAQCGTAGWNVAAMSSAGELDGIEGVERGTGGRV